MQSGNTRLTDLLPVNTQTSNLGVKVREVSALKKGVVTVEQVSIYAVRKEGKHA